MTLDNAMKKLEKNGFTIEENKYVAGSYTAIKKGSNRFIKFFGNNGDKDCVNCIGTETFGLDHTTWHDNMNQAIDYVINPINL